MRFSLIQYKNAAMHVSLRLRAQFPGDVFMHGSIQLSDIYICRLLFVYIFMAFCSSNRIRLTLIRKFYLAD